MSESNATIPPFSARRARVIAWAAVIVLTLFAVYKLPPKYSYTGDGLTKAIQAHSLLFHGSEQLYYPAADIDPRYAYYPFPGVYRLEVQPGRFVGPFPVLFAAASVPVLAVFGKIALPVWNCVLFLLLLYLLQRWWSVHPLTIVWAAFTTPLILYAVEYSENILFILLVFAGLTLFLKSLPEEDDADGSIPAAIGGGLLVGLGVWLRLEALIFFAILGGVAFVVHRGWRRSNIVCMLAGAAGFFAALLAFCVWNAFDYGHFLGPRYIAEGGGAGFFRDFSVKLDIWITLVFGKLQPLPKLGFLAYMPVFLIVWLHLLRPSIFRALSLNLRTLLISTLIFVPLVPWFAPHDGITAWGPRYLALAILPCCLLFDRALRDGFAAASRTTFGRWLFDLASEKNDERPGLRSAPDLSGGSAIGSSRRYGRGAVALLFALLLVGLAYTPTMYGIDFYRTAVKQLRKFQKDFAGAPADVRVFTNPLFAQHMGLQYFETPSMLLMQPRRAPALLERLKTHAAGKTVVVYEAPSMFGNPGDNAGPAVNAAFTAHESLEAVRVIPLPESYGRATVYRVK